MILVDTHLIVLLLIAGNAITWAQIFRKDVVHGADYERSKRALDFGLFVRNLLLNSATASNAKANISRNIINLKTTTAAPTRRTTTTTTVNPFFFNKGPFKFPFDLSIPINNKFNNGGFINFDYNDYGPAQAVRPGRRRRPTTTTTTTTVTTTTTTGAPPPPPPPASAAPQIPGRRPIPRRPFGLFGKQKLPFFDYYNDYDYNYDDVDDAPATSTTPASPAPPPAAPAPSPAATPAPSPNPPPARPRQRPVANVARAKGRVPQLRNRLVYQFRQPGDTSSNNAAAQPPADDSAAPLSNSNTNNSNNDETSTDTNDYTDDADNDDDVAANDEGADNNNNPNMEQAFNDSSDSANPNVNTDAYNGNGNVPDDAAAAAPPPPPPASAPSAPASNFNANLPPFQGQFGFGANLNGPSGFANFGPSAGFQYQPFNNAFNSQYQQLSPTGYSVRYY